MGERVFRSIKIAVTGIALSVVAVGPAHAYVDPGSGTLLVQLLVAAAVGATFYFRRALFNIKSFFVGNRKDPEEPPDTKRDAAPED